jgi:predicted dehydrogenase
MRLRVAVIGAGYIGQLHARVIAESPLAQVAAIVDVNRERPFPGMRDPAVIRILQ